MIVGIQQAPTQTVQQWMDSLKTASQQTAAKATAVARPEAARPQDSLTVYRGSGMRPFAYSWKKPPPKSGRLISSIAANRGRVEKLRYAGNAKDRRTKYQYEISNYQKELGTVYANAPEHTFIVES